VRVGYADLKNDVVFRKVFGQHPRVLAGLLNDLLERSGEREITELEYLPGEQAPLVLGLKLSILDVRCRERGGATFIVEMQVLHVTGFLNRVVYNACKAYVGALKKGAAYGELVDVVAVSICDFVLWPDAERDAATAPRVPLVSRWSMAEQASGHRALGQVQYVFVELPKLGDEVPDSANERWAALFAHAQDLEPRSLVDVPLTTAQREALELAREETFTQAERDAIERSHEEVDQVRRTLAAADARVEAETRARAEAEARVAEAEAKIAEAEAHVVRASSARAEAEEKAARESSARAEAEEKAAREASARAEAEEKAAREANARTEAEEKAAREASARTEAEEKAAAAEARIRELEALLGEGRDKA
jgi:predicted transposase/invertase (TIGR01784 family)